MSFENILQETETEREQWISDKKSEREELSMISDNGVMLITSDPQSYSAYLDLQANNSTISPSNLGIVMDTMPEATKVYTLEKWNKVGRSVKPMEQGIKVFISEMYTDRETGEKRRGYKVGRMFDIVQTNGNQLEPSPVLNENTPQMNAALKSLINLAPVRVVVNKDMSNAAYYNPAKKVIAVNADKGERDIFRELTAEIVHAVVHSGGGDGYERGEVSIDAQSISYMLCTRFGVPCNKPDASRIFDVFDGADISDRRDSLNFLKNTNDRIGHSIERDAFPDRQKERQNDKRPRQNDAR